MRNFRNVALATATAATIAITGTGAAIADTPAPAATGTQADVFGKGTKGKNDTDLSTIITEGTKGVLDGKGASEFSRLTDGKTPFDVTKAAGKETNWQEVPQWARLWVDGTLIAGIAAAIGGVIAAVNWASYNGWIQLPQLGR